MLTVDVSGGAGAGATSATVGASNVKETGAGGSGTEESSFGLIDGTRRALDPRDSDWKGADMGRRGSIEGVGEERAGGTYGRDVSSVDGVYGVGGAVTIC